MLRLSSFSYPVSEDLSVIQGAFYSIAYNQANQINGTIRRDNPGVSSFTLSRKTLKKHRKSKASQIECSILLPSSIGSSLGAVASRSFGLVRFKFFLQIDPSAPGPELITSSGIGV